VSSGASSAAKAGDTASAWRWAPTSSAALLGTRKPSRRTSASRCCATDSLWVLASTSTRARGRPPRMAVNRSRLVTIRCSS